MRELVMHLKIALVALKG